MANRIKSQFFYPFTARRRKLKIFLLLSLLFSLLLLTLQCSFEKPSSPSWDVEVSIPLISKQFTMDEIADDEDAINVDSTTGLLSFAETSELDEYQVGDQLDIDDITDSFTQELGTFDIDSPGSEFTSVELQEIYEDAEI